MLMNHLTLPPLPLPRCEIAKLERESRKSYRLPDQERFVEGCEFLKQQADRPAVSDDMMHRQQQNVFLSVQMEYSRPQQWSPRQIKRTLQLLRCQLQNHWSLLRCCYMLKIF